MITGILPASLGVFKESLGTVVIVYLFNIVTTVVPIARAIFDPPCV